MHNKVLSISRGVRANGYLGAHRGLLSHHAPLPHWPHQHGVPLQLPAELDGAQGGAGAGCGVRFAEHDYQLLNFPFPIPRNGPSRPVPPSMGSASAASPQITSYMQAENRYLCIIRGQAAQAVEFRGL